jgi:hypothetical protein
MTVAPLKGGSNLRVLGGRSVLVLGALDAAVQVLVVVAPHPFQGIGILGFALLPVILAYYAVLLGAIVAGIPLAIGCFWLGGVNRVVLGTVLVALTVVNAVSVANFIIRDREASRIEEVRDAASGVEAAKCSAARAQKIQEDAAYFGEPRRVVAIAGPYAVQFENGIRINLPPSDRPQLFREFFYDRLLGSQVRVVLIQPSTDELTARCRGAGTGGTAGAAGYSNPYDGAVYLLDRKIDAASYVDREFPRPPGSDGNAGAPVKRISRWFDAASGDRTYSTTGAKPIAGYAREGQPFSLRADPGAESRGVYLCNAPLHRPDSPEHFLSTDAACEGQEKISLLGYVSSIRDGRTPRALLRCLGTVQSPLRTGPRHLITIDIKECRDHSIEMVLGYVEG